jgi:hypothetical protein
MKDLSQTSDKSSEIGTRSLQDLLVWLVGNTNVIDATVDVAESNETKHYLIIMKYSLCVCVCVCVCFFFLAMFIFWHSCIWEYLE